VDLAISEVRRLVERAAVRQDFLDACRRRDLGTIITILKALGVTQGHISELTGIPQGRLSEWAQHRRVPRATSSFEKFADGLGIPPAARQALGLSPQPAGNPGIRRARPPGAADTTPAGARPSATQLPGATSAGLAGLCGLESVQSQLEDVIAVLEAEQNRRNAGLPVRRQAWKNLVFTGGPGSGKSRAAAALGCTYQKLGVLTRGHVIEAPAADLAGTGPQETAKLLAEAIRPATGGILVVNAAHEWQQLPDRGQQVLRRLYAELTEYRNERKDELAVILAGRADQLRELLDGNPSLAPRFRAVIPFPGYTPRQLAAVFAALAGEAGLRLTSVAARKAADVLAQAEGEHGSGNARPAVRLLNQATAAQARRVAVAPSRGREAALNTITDADIPDYLPPYGTAQEDYWSGVYL
jgi:transcriptional regulator with XRE-family HTH domain